jgi:hypothetical protein
LDEIDVSKVEIKDLKSFQKKLNEGDIEFLLSGNLNWNQASTYSAQIIQHLNLKNSGT